MERRTYPPYLLNGGVSLQPLPPEFVSGAACLPENMSFTNVTPPIAADQTLSECFSFLNLSPAPPFVPNPFSAQIGVSGGGSGGAGEGFAHPMMMNSVPTMHSDLGVNGYYVNRQRWSDEMEARRRYCSSGFDFDLDFDRNKTLNFTPHFDQTSGNKMKFPLLLDDYDQITPCCSSSFQNQNQNQNKKSQSESQSQNQDHSSPWSFKKLRGRVYTMAKDQNGCRILQAMFENPTLEEVEFVLSEVVDLVSDLMKDQFGNYLVQKLVPLCNDNQKMQLILSLIKDIVLVCMNPHGTRSMQKLLESLQDPNQVKLVMKALHHGATTLAVDPNGHHVIQYCLVNFHTDINMPILTEIANECYKIATDRSGCCVLQACVEHTRGEVRTRILAEIMTNSVLLAEDPYGNYVLQHMVGMNIPELTALLVRQLQGNFATLSCNKYGSNVVEKCLNESGEGISTRIVLELIRSPNSSMLLIDPYANFVIQSALKVSKGYAYECLCALISKNMWSMQTNIYGKKILGRFNKKKVNFA